MKAILQLSFSSILFYALIFSFPNAHAQNAVGDWCGTSTNTECGACLSDGIMQAQPNARTKTKPRMMYVSDWVEFKSNTSDPTIKPNPYYTIDTESIFGNFIKEKELLDYACKNGFDGLILYNIPKILERHAGHFNDDTNLLSWPQELARFIVFAKHFYHLEIEMVAPKSGNGGMWENINDYYDLAAIGNGNLNNINAFQQHLEENCGNTLTNYNPNDPTIGNYFGLGDYPTAYPVDGEGRYHPFDKAIIDILNIGTFQQQYSNGLITKDWWAKIIKKIQEEYGGNIFETEWCGKVLVKANCETYSSYNAIIT
ncbi:MAG: hypothetical protein ACPGRC_11535, partial [Salibacteraceae bacterium]